MTAIGDHATFFEAVSTGPWADPDDPGRRAADALRRLAVRALAGAPGDAELAALADQLEAISPRDAAPAVGSRYREGDTPSDDGSRPIRPNGNGSHPIIGARNPVAPPLVLRLEDGVVYADVTYDVRYEGLPGLAQGGFLAAAFDVMLGQGVAVSGQGGVTGTLSVRFVAPTPLGVPLQYEARFDRREGRKVFGTSLLRRLDDGSICAQAEGVFISPRGSDL